MFYKFTYNANLKKSFLHDIHPNAPQKTIQYRIISVLLILIIVISLSLFPISRAIDNHLTAILTTSDVKYKADQLILKIIEQTEAQRAFSLTRSKESATSFAMSSNEIKQIVFNLEKLTYNRPTLTKNYQRVKTLIIKRDNYLQNLMTNMSALPKDKFPPSSPNIEQNIRSSEIIKLILSFVDHEENAATSHYDRLNFLRLMLNYMAITAILLTLFLTYFINKKLRRNLEQLKAYHNQLAEENTWLETHVQERTIELEEATKHAQKERQRVEFLLQDASHRIGNSLATASSLLSIQINNSKNSEVKSALTVARDHIQTIATAHRRLRLSEDMDTADCKEFFETIIKDIQLSLPPQKRANITIDYQIERLKMSARDATTLAIIAGELITNAVKHAFPAKKKGRIFVKLAQSRDKVNLIVEDDGKGFPPNITRSNGLGHLIISKLSMQFDAKPSFKNLKNGGARVTLSIKNIKPHLNDNSA